jgi:hypothetical protein
MIETDKENGIVRKPRHHMRSNEPSGNKMLPLRNILNLIFMLGAIAGVVIYYVGNTRIGIIIVLVAMAVKMVECVIRMTVK